MTTLYSPERLSTIPAPADPLDVGPRHRRHFFHTPGWSLRVALYGFPIFWLCGLGEFVWPIMALPMASQLWRQRRPVRVPPYFGLWLLLLVWVIAGAAMIGQPLVGTLLSSGGYVGWAVRSLDLLSATVVLLYLGNISEDELPTRKVIRMLGFLFAVTVLGGLLGIAFGNVSFTSPFELILPHSIRTNNYVQQLVHPGFAEVEGVLGHTSPRPKAPFAYTNNWGNNLSLLLIWFMVGWWARGSRRMKLAAFVTVIVAVVPVIYSINRGLWIGLGLSLVFAAFHLAARGRLGLLASALAIGAVGALVFSLTPLNSIVSQRLQHPHSNAIRSSLNTDAYEAALRSPIVGWGTTRSTLGSPSSIAVGKTSLCPTCGNAPIGSTGELWTLLIANGFVGTAAFFGFILLVAFSFRRDRSPEGIAARTVLYLAPFYALFYPSLPTALTLTFISMALLWRANSSSMPRVLGEPG